MNNERYTIQQAAAIFGVTPETVRSWSIEFQGYLSRDANPGANRKRLLTHEDMGALGMVAELRRANLELRDIHATLANGNRAEIPVLSPEQVQALVTGSREMELSIQLETAHAIVKELQSRLEEAHAKLEQMADLEKQAARNQVRAEMLQEQIDKGDQQREALQRQLNEALQALGRAQGELEFLRKQQS